ncbi:MAG: antitermination protein NusG [Gammaproteobacteria bacterium]|nr:antitermination protein NusG [Gammaproteobacteria bacterium]
MELLTDQSFFRAFHILFGIAWIGLLYYFNFVQTEYVKVADPEAKADVMKKLAPNALWWFRWAALFTFLTGLILFYQIQATISTEIILGATMGTFMMLNVWGIIWRNQKIVIGLKDGDATAAAAKAGLASRTNTLFSVPMLMYMVYSAHDPGGNHWIINENWDSTSLIIGLVIILLIEANAIWGKMHGVIMSVKAVIVSSFILAIILKLITDYLPVFMTAQVSGAA